MSAKTPFIMPKPTESDIRVNNIFSNISAAAVQYGFPAIQVRSTSMRWLIIEAPLRVLPNIGPRQQCVRLLIDQDENYKFQVLDVPVHSGKIDNNLLHTYLKQMQPNSGYDMCPGVEDEYMKVKDKLERKPVVLHEWPGGIRYDHINCEIWFNSATISKRSSKNCKKCDSLIRSMRITAKNVANKNCVKTTTEKRISLNILTPKMRKKFDTLKKVHKKHLDRENSMGCSDSEQGEEMKDSFSGTKERGCGHSVIDKSPSVVAERNRNIMQPTAIDSTNCLSCVLRETISNLQTTCRQWICNSCVKLKSSENSTEHDTEASKADTQVSESDTSKTSEIHMNDVERNDQTFIMDSILTCQTETEQKNVEKLKAALTYAKNTTDSIITAEQNAHEQTREVIMALTNNLNTSRDFIVQCAQLINMTLQEHEANIHNLVEKRKEICAFAENVKKCVKRTDLPLRSTIESSVQFEKNLDLYEINRVLDTQPTIDKNILNVSVEYEYKRPDKIDVGELDVGVLIINGKSLPNRLKIKQSGCNQELLKLTSAKSCCEDSDCTACSLNLQIDASSDIENDESIESGTCLETDSGTESTDKKLPILVTVNAFSGNEREEFGKTVQEVSNVSPPVLMRETMSALDKTSSLNNISTVYSASEVSSDQTSFEKLEVEKHGDVLRYTKPSSAVKSMITNVAKSKSGRFEDENSPTVTNVYGLKFTEINQERPNKFLNPYVNLCPKALFEYERRKGNMYSMKPCLKTGAVVSSKAEVLMKLTESYFHSVSSNEMLGEQATPENLEVNLDQQCVMHIKLEKDDLGIQANRAETSYEVKNKSLSDGDRDNERSPVISNFTESCCSDIEKDRHKRDRSETHVTWTDENQNNVIQTEKIVPDASSKMPDILGKNLNADLQTQSEPKTNLAVRHDCVKNNDLSEEQTKMVASVCKTSDKDEMVIETSSDAPTSPSEGHNSLLSVLNNNITNILYTCLTKPTEKPKENTPSDKLCGETNALIPVNNTVKSMASADLAKSKPSKSRKAPSAKSKSVMRVSSSLYKPVKRKQNVNSESADIGKSGRKGNQKAKRMRTQPSNQMVNQTNLASEAPVIQRQVSCSVEDFHSDREAIKSLYASEHCESSAELPSSARPQKALLYSRTLGSFIGVSENTQAIMDDPSLLVEQNNTIQAAAEETGKWQLIQSHIPPARDIPQIQYPHTTPCSSATHNRDIPCHPAVSSCPVFTHSGPRLPILKHRAGSLPPYPELSYRLQNEPAVSGMRSFDEVDASNRLHSPRFDNRRGPANSRFQGGVGHLENTIHCQNNPPAYTELIHVESAPSGGDIQNRENAPNKTESCTRINDKPQSTPNVTMCYDDAPPRQVPGRQAAQRNKNIPQRLEILPSQLLFGAHFGPGLPRHCNQFCYENVPPNRNIADFQPRNSVPRNRYPAPLNKIPQQSDRTCSDIDALRNMFIMTQRIAHPPAGPSPLDYFRLPPNLPQCTRPYVREDSPSFTQQQFDEANAAIQTSFIQNQIRPRYGGLGETAFTEITNQLCNQQRPGKGDNTYMQDGTEICGEVSFSETVDTGDNDGTRAKYDQFLVSPNQAATSSTD